MSNETPNVCHDVRKKKNPCSGFLFEFLVCILLLYLLPFVFVWSYIRWKAKKKKERETNLKELPFS